MTEEKIKVSISVDSQTYDEFKKLMNELACDTDTAFNIFIHACVNKQGFPFMIRLD